MNRGNQSAESSDSGTQVSGKSAAPATNTPAAAVQIKSGDTNEVAVIKTTDGEMVVAFWPDVAPRTVENFKTLARKGFYNGTTFHRIIKGFMIQGGDPLTKDPANSAKYGQGGPGYTIPAEFSNRPHETGVISMARLPNNINSAGSQFFICDAPADSPGMRALDGKYTDFGKLIKGYDVLQKIANTAVSMSASGEMSKPTVRVEVKSITIVPANTVK